MKYKVELTIQGYVEVEADSESDARAQVEDGYSMNDFNFEDDEIGDISEVKK